MTFYVGQKVVCIGFRKLSWRERWHYFRHPPRGGSPIEGKIYTIAGFGRGTIDLVEVYSPADEYWEPGFKAEGFRPVAERKTDISVFTALLTPAHARSKELCGND